MPIEFNCTGCQRLLRVPDDAAGKQTKCPACSLIMPVPAASVAAPFAEPAPTPSAFSPALPSAAFSDRFRDTPAKPESFNPYASPVQVEQHDYSTSSGDANFVIRPSQFGFDELLSLTWQVFKSHTGKFALLGLVLFGVFVAQQVAAIVLGLVAEASNSPAVAVSVNLGLNVMNFVVQVATTLGGFAYCLKLLRTGQTDFSAFMSFASSFWQGLLKDFLVGLLGGLGVLIILVPALATLPLEAPEISIPAFIVCGLAAAVAMIFVGMSVFTAGVFLVDRRLGAVEALQEAWRCSSGNRLTLFLASLVVGLVGGLFSVCTIYLGLVLFLPYMSLFACVAYLLMVGQRQSISPAARGSLEFGP